MLRAMFTAILLMGACASAQTGVTPVLHTAPLDPARFPLNFYSEAKQPPSVDGPVTGAPFTANLILTDKDNGHNGAVESTAMTVARSRDSAGRVRIQMADPRVLPGVDKAYLVQVRDPVSHCVIDWEEPISAAGDQPVATFICQPRVVAYGKQPGPIWAETVDPQDQSTEAEETRVSDRKERIESLPEEVMEGVQTIGMRLEAQEPAQGQNPATREVRIMRFSPELHETMLDDTESFNDAGRTRRSIIALKDVRLAEPDASLFYPPAGYQRVDGSKPAGKP